MNGPISFITIFLLALLVTVLIRGDFIPLFPSLTNFFRDIFYSFQAFYHLIDGTDLPTHHSSTSDFWFPYPLIVVLVIIIFIILLWDK